MGLLESQSLQQVGNSAHHLFLSVRAVSPLPQPSSRLEELSRGSSPSPACPPCSRTPRHCRQEQGPQASATPPQAPPSCWTTSRKNHHDLAATGEPSHRSAQRQGQQMGAAKGRSSPREMLHVVDAPRLLQENCFNGQLHALPNIPTLSLASPSVRSSACVHHVPEP